ncbi:hypothetical protein [Lacticaseibacillus absianus]|uniref:hypothetical protein n=1 Tax=Lacticaseibacillus absianus TaxID=2729623 RepID=UPI0015CEB94F|nr:hypothetical protein [Lacticaseibacillus absianus]
MATQHRLENTAMTRVFTVVDQRLFLGRITNHLSGQTLTPAPGSEVFYLSLGLDRPDRVAASDLTVTAVEPAATATEQTLTVRFAPLVHRTGTWTIRYEVRLAATVTYSHVVMTCSTQTAALDYAELEALKLPAATAQFARPSDFVVPETEWNFPAHEFLLGQPVYTDSLFWGCEFPATDNQIVADQIHLRYQPGQSFAARRQSERLTAEGAWQSPDFVMGVAPRAEQASLQAALLAYLAPRMPATPLRCQYNSWYDDRMGVTSDRAMRLFEQAHRALADAGVPPLDAYVVDDGWNNYNDPDFTGIDVARSGRTFNQTGFWSFNDKFPDELYPTSALAKRFGATFGLWLGPQGGYELNATFAQFLEQAGTGYLNRQAASGAALDVAARRYTKRLKALFLDYQARFEIHYWKLDGFASRPGTDPDHDHPVGGPAGAYATTALWEDWRDIFVAMREATPDLFLNVTCFINPSPWWLQYVNTIWLQNSGDLEQSGSGCDADRMITGRDAIYYRNLNDAQVQFPLSHYYNHEPIYGHAAHVTMTTPEFRRYLFATAVRGSRLWELYFSPSMMDQEKWQIVADVLAFVREYQEALDHVVMIGGDPRAGAVYGYQGWTATTGVVSLSNPSDQAQAYAVPLGATAGQFVLTQWEPVAQEAHPVVQADETITGRLEPHETRLMTFTSAPVVAPKLTAAQVMRNDQIRLRFDRRVRADNVYAVDGQPVIACQLGADRRTVTLTRATTCPIAHPVRLEINGLPGWEGGRVDQVIALQAHPDGVIGRWSAAADEAVMPGVPTWQAEFSLRLELSAEFEPGSLVSQSNLLSLAVRPDGQLQFTCADQVLIGTWQETRVVVPEHGRNGTPAHRASVVSTADRGQLELGRSHTVTVTRAANRAVMLQVDGELVASGLMTADGGGEPLTLNRKNIVTATLTQD